MTTVRILSAAYGPSMDDATHLGIGFLGSAAGTRVEQAHVPLAKTRDVLPFVQILLNIAARDYDYKSDSEEILGRVEGVTSEQGTNLSFLHQHGSLPLWGDVKIPKNVNTLTLFEAGQSMNTLFGDPAPGTTKRLSLTYMFFDETLEYPETLSCSFSEHGESIILKRFPSLGYTEDQRESESITSIDIKNEIPPNVSSPSVAKRARSVSSSSSSSSRPMGSYIWETILPMILPFLELRQRIDSQCVCKTWRSVIQDWGYLQVLDVSNSSIVITPSFVSGVLAQSYASLHSLYLARFHELTESILIPALPQLRKLTTLDISYCSQLGDATAEALSQYSKIHLEVLYMKALNRVTDHGVSCIARGCTYLRILDVSFIQLSDTSATLIGNHLIRLEALYLRDNYMLTNQSIDVISRNCTKLKQLTLWGCIKLSHFLGESSTLATGSREFKSHPSTQGLGSITSMSDNSSIYDTRSCEHLVLLNLWGVHGLTDGIASTIKTLVSLRTLIVSECHKLSDAFVVNIATSAIGPRIQHFHLRFLRKLTDSSVMAIAHNMTSLYSLDLSFCTLITLDSIVFLLEKTSTFLCELRLYSCCQMDLTLPATEMDSVGITDNALPIMSIAGTRLFEAIRLHGNYGTLCLLDVRGCVGAYPNHEVRTHDTFFVNSMNSLGYKQLIPGFFQRPTQWTETMKHQYYAYLLERK